MQLPRWSYKANYYWNHQLYIISLLSSSIPDPFHVPPSLLKAEQYPFLLFNSFYSPNPSPHDAYLSNHLSTFLSGLLHPHLCCSVSYSPEVGTEDGTAFQRACERKGWMQHHCLHGITKNSKWFLKDSPRPEKSVKDLHIQWLPLKQPHRHMNVGMRTLSFFISLLSVQRELIQCP